MLRPELYKRLEKQFGAVAIANDSEAMVFGYRPTVSGNELNIVASGEYYRVDCCFCDDTRKRLWINHRWGLYDHTSRSRNLFLAHCYNETGCLSKPGRHRDLYNIVFSNFVHEDMDVLYDSAPVEAEPVKAELPGTLVPVNELELTHPARRYLEELGYNADVLVRHFHLGFCTEASPNHRSAQSRIIIPIFMDGELRGWQARYVGKPAKHTPKYVSMTHMRRNHLLYNFDIARKHSSVVLVEGAKDVWSFGPEAVGLFGKTISQTQLSLLIGAGWQKIYVVLDRDAMVDAIGIYDMLGSNVTKYLVELPEGNSPGDLPTPTLRDVVFNHRHTISTESRQ